MKNSWAALTPLALALAMLTPLSGCQSHQKCDDKAGACAGKCQQTADQAKALMALDDQWSAAASRRDTEKVASFYAQDAIAFPPGAPAAHGRDAARKVWADTFAIPNFQISWKSNDAFVASCGSIGYTSGTFQCSFTGPDGKQVSDVGKFLCVWQKQADGSWKATRDMWNSDRQ